MKPAYIIAFFVIAVCMAVTLFALSGAMTHHVNVVQAKQRAGEVVQVPGDIVKETVVYDARSGSLRFDIVDKFDKSQRLSVVYPEPKPENFDTANAVEAIGTYKNGAFVADRLLVKCPSKYNDEKPAAGGAKPATYEKPASYQKSAAAELPYKQGAMSPPGAK